MPRLFMFVVIVFVYIVVAQNILFLEILSVIWTKKILVKFLPTPLSQSWSIEPEKSNPPKKILTPSLFLKTKIYPKKYFWLNETKKNKAQKINPWEYCAHPKKWATNKNIRVVQFLLQGFLLFWKYKRTNHKRNYLKKAY